MKSKFFLAVLICLLTSSSFAESFEAFNTKISLESNIQKLEEYKNQETKKYQQTKDIYYRYNSKYVEFYLADRSQNANAAIAALSWVVEDYKGSSDKNQIAWFYYHLASNLNAVKAHRLSLEYAIKSLRFAELTKNSELLILTNSLVGSVNFELKKYDKASTYYLKAYRLYSENDFFNRSSMLNNMALCDIKLNKNQHAKSKLFYSLKLLKRIKNKNVHEKLFYFVVEGNLGTVFHRLGNEQLAINYLEKEVAYYLLPNVQEFYKAEVPLIELLTLYQTTGNASMVEKTLSRMDDVFHSKKTTTDYPILTEAMFNYYRSSGNNQKALLFAERLRKELTLFAKMKIDRSETLNGIIYSNRLSHLKDVKDAQELKVKNATIEKRFFQFISAIAVLILAISLIIAFALNRSKKKNMKKDMLIEEQKQNIQEVKNRILENENKIQEEKIVNLAMNLSIKNATEKVFLSKINELKRKKNVDTEAVLKELQVSVSNLMNVDKKLLFNKIETDDIVQKFKSKLIHLHPTLTKSDLEYCCYFRLNMSAKEIGSIHGQSDGSVRVLKNKIKNKLNLKDGITLFDYLNEIYH